jgi:hypothetical protein
VDVHLVAAGDHCGGPAVVVEGSQRCHQSLHLVPEGCQCLFRVKLSGLGVESWLRGLAEVDAGVGERQDLMVIEWPQIEFARDRSSYAMETLAMYAPQLFGRYLGPDLMTPLERAALLQKSEPQRLPFSTEIIESPDGTVTVRHSGHGKVEADGIQVTKDAIVKLTKCPNCGHCFDVDVSANEVSAPAV